MQQRVVPVAEALTSSHTAQRISAAMSTNGLFPESIAQGIVEGERGRILGLGRAYWPFFYGLPLERMAEAGHPVKSLFEKGPSIEAHTATIPLDLQPQKSLAVDFPHIARGATVSLDVLKEQGLLRQDADYAVVSKEQVPSNYRADLAASILEAQYDNLKELAHDLFQHSDTILIGDVLHGLVRLPLKHHRTESGDTVPFNTSTHPESPSGFQLIMGEEIGQYENRRYLRYTLTTDSNIVGEDKKIHSVSANGNQEGTCTIITGKDGKEYVQAWTFRPKPGANEEDIKKVIEAEETLHDLYASTKNWDGLGAMGVLHGLKHGGWLRRKQLDTIVTTTIVPASEMSGRLPLSILFVNKEQLVKRGNSGELRHIGKGKKYATVEDFLAMVQTQLMVQTSTGKTKIDELVIFDPPPLLDILASKNEQLIQDVLTSFGR
jgi:hypothetical protein